MSNLCAAYLSNGEQAPSVHNGKVPGKAKFVQSSCFQGDGNAYLVPDTPINFNLNSYQIKVRFRYNINSYSGYIFGSQSSQYRYWSLSSAGLDMRMGIVPDNNQIAAFSTAHRHGDIFEATLNTDGGWSVTRKSLDGSTETVTGVGTVDSVSRTVDYIGAGRNGDNALLDSKLFDLSIETIGNTKNYWPLCEPIKDPSNHTYHDVSGNGNHATLVNGTLANNGYQDQLHYLQNGFSNNGLDLRNSNILTSNAVAFGHKFEIGTPINYILFGGEFIFNSFDVNSYQRIVDLFTNSFHRITLGRIQSNFAVFGGPSSVTFLSEDRLYGLEGDKVSLIFEIDPISDTYKVWVNGILRINASNVGMNQPYTPTNHSNANFIIGRSYPNTEVTDARVFSSFYIVNNHLNATNIEDIAYNFNSVFQHSPRFATVFSDSYGSIISGYNGNNGYFEGKINDSIWYNELRPKQLNQNLDALGNPITIPQDGYSFLNTGTLLEPYPYPALIQADKDERFWFIGEDENGNPISRKVNHYELALENLMSDKLFIDKTDKTQ